MVGFGLYEVVMTTKKTGKTLLIKGLTLDDIALFKAAAEAEGRSVANLVRFVMRDYCPRILREKGIALPSAQPSEAVNEDGSESGKP
jgi:hypothetical protein